MQLAGDECVWPPVQPGVHFFVLVSPSTKLMFCTRIKYAANSLLRSLGFSSCGFSCLTSYKKEKGEIGLLSSPEPKSSAQDGGSKGNVEPRPAFALSLEHSDR